MKKTFLVLAALAMLSTYAMADGSAVNVNTTAVLSCSGNPPYITHKFELPDEDPLEPGTQIYPVPGGTKAFKVYMVVCDDNGAGDIKTVKARVSGPNPFVPVEAYGSSVSPNTPLQQAVNAGLITATERDNILYQINTANLCKLYKADFTLDNCDPAGMYTVIATACDDCGCGCLNNTNEFEYYSIVAVDIDFTTVNYGPISVGNEKTVPGDAIMENVGVAPPVKPSVQNLGNDPMDVIISATDMTGNCGGVTAVIPANAQKAKVDGSQKLQLSKTGTCFNVNLACETPTFINFYLTPPAGTCATAYSGQITVTGVHDCGGV